MCSRILSLPALLVVCLAPPASSQGSSTETLARTLPAGVPGPRLRTPDGAPRAGGSFALEVSGGAPGLAGKLALGLHETPLFLPRFGATLYPSPPFLQVPFLLDGSGHSPRLVETQPLDPALLGVEGAAQAVVFDPAGLQFTNGLRLRIGLAPDHPLPALASDLGEKVDALACGDLDGDGLLDVVTIDRGLGRTSVGLGDGRGGFTLHQTTIVPTSAHAAALGDFDGDTHIDLAFTTTSYAQLLQVQRGTGTGSLGGPLSFPVGTNPGELVAADFTGDGRDDLAVANGGSKDLTILHKWQNGKFQASVTVPVPQAPKDLLALDLDEDGRLDLAVTTGTTVTVLLGHGNGTFDPAVEFDPGGGAFLDSLSSADLNADGHTDLVVTTTGSSGGSVVALLGLGDGSLVIGATSLPGPAATGPPLLADLDGDGLVDLLLPRAGLFYEVGLGLGDSSFSSAASYTLGSRLTDPVLRDFDGDGHADLVGGHGTTQLVAFYRGLDDGVFPKLTRIGGQSFPLSVARADFNGDFVPDLAIANRFSTSLSVELGDGEGGFTEVGPLGAGDTMRSIATGDLDGNGTDDIVVPDAFGLAVVLGNGDGTFAPAVQVAVGGTSNAVALADVDEDGHLDVLLGRASSDGLAILFGLGGGALSAPVFLATGVGVSDLVARDLDGDGHVDVAAAAGAALQVRYGNGSGDLPLLDTLPLPAGASAVAIADFNEDGVLDLAAALRSAGELATLRGLGGRDFAAAVTLPTGTEPDPVRAADLDGDGHVDLYAANGSPLFSLTGGRTVSVHLGRGDGTFEPLRRFAAPTIGGIVDVIAADFDLDGEQDLAAVDYGSSSSLLPGTVLVLFGIAGD